MFRRAYRSRLDRILAAIELPALGLWLGALCGFAFIFAPEAFRRISDVGQFAALVAANLAILAKVGYVCGAIAIVIALVRSRDAADRTNDIVRAGLVLIALVLVAYLSYVIVPAMEAITNLRSETYADLHRWSTTIYGGVVVLGFAALVLAAARNDQ